jgi:hypothetical protein
VRREGGWALAVWEGDAPEAVSWISLDGRVQIIGADDGAAALSVGAQWLVVLVPTQVFSNNNEPLWVAQPGEWYRLLDQQTGWALAAWESDPPDMAVWVQLDENVGLSVG